MANGNVVGNIGGVTNVYTFASTGMSVVGNVTANYLIGNGSQLTGLPASYGNALFHHGLYERGARIRWPVEFGPRVVVDIQQTSEFRG